VIEVRHLTKRYGAKAAVDDLSFTVRPGLVTGFLGPNGAGKTTTMRAILGLCASSSGETLVNGFPYRSLQRPMYEVGALLDANAVQADRSAFNHLYALALTNGIGRSRVSAVLKEVGLGAVANKRIQTFSLGMRQRLGIAGALLGDPGILLCDEPVNGLDPDGVRWIRELMQSLAAEGRTVFLSSHLMSEMELTADQLIIIGRGKLIADASLVELARRFQRGALVRSARIAELSRLLEAAGATVAFETPNALSVSGMETIAIGELAAQHGIPIHEMTQRSASLEQAYTELTAASVEFASAPRAR